MQILRNAKVREHKCLKAFGSDKAYYVSNVFRSNIYANIKAA
jgi:hypothetical protein